LLSLLLAGNVAKAAPAPPTPITIDITEDNKAMGYPDGRKVVRDTDGNLYVAYRKKYKAQLRTAYHIFVAKSQDDGRTWEVLNQGHPVESAGDQNQRVPSIAIDSHDTLHVVWYGKDDRAEAGQENQIKYVSSTDRGRTWSAWRNLAYVPGYADQTMWQEHPMLYIDQDDILYIAWEGRDAWYSDRAQIKFIRSLDGGERWSLWKNVAPSPTTHSRPTIVGTASATLYLFAYSRVDDRQQIVYNRSTNGGITWGAWATVAPAAAEQRHVSAVADSQGQVHVVWRQESPASFGLTKSVPKTEIQYATFDGHAWSSPVRIQPGRNAAQTFPSIGVIRAEPTLSSAEDTLWIVWSETTEGYNYPNDTLVSGQIYAIAKRADGWSAPLALASGEHNIYASIARRGGHGAGTNADTIDVVWLDNQEDHKEIRFAQLTNFAQDVAFSVAPKSSSQGLLRAQPEVKPIVMSGVEAPYWLYWRLSNLLWNSHLAREMQTLILIVIAATGYTLLKFFLLRWLPNALPHTE